ncbi:MAG: hypothetical protein KJ718_05070 [Nanoarchaeota archaeon]|nr:hypothetical protein [Nanoarchaeota archaeon]MBU1051897.1 hypothetical protein [Nanoarchaeota archaeon]MBU1988940.1 hypothetical protein [Nanoarchaeota archaeon]
MKKILVFIGCWRGQFVQDIKFFDTSEKKLKCKVKRSGKFSYQTKINNSLIKFQFCFGPDNDLVWRKRNKLKENLPPSIEHLSKMKIDADEIYYLGFCGVLKGKSEKVFLPASFRKVIFDRYVLHDGHLKSMKFGRKISCKNNLMGRIEGKKCTCITSNQVLSLRYVKNNSPEILYKLAKKLSKHVDIVEMENYEIVKRFGKGKNLGIFLYGCDSLAIRRKTLGDAKFRNRWGKFNKLGVEMIKEITKKELR